ncbi:hypothetical protein [Endozoicomonas sp. 8E]|uniref:hypothetical protein n=1 Tax=Endozoicomonas sp. 8E TaxID=3035692 RepID=UPI00293914C8|nr:hypothetical protein [Endozoicomonas sp. 8E]WOG29667.1 hypothetical protein P6910_08430 [Endozoicomonas sp. 8E]
MHISETIKTNPLSSPADWQTATTETVKAFAREVAAYPGKTYLPESENVFFSHNPFWHHEGQFRFTPTLKTPSHIGMVYKGDSRPPETIFKTGFNRKSDDSDSINDNDFLEALLSTKLSPYKLTHGPDFFGSYQLVNDSENKIISTSRNVAVATWFPMFSSQTEPDSPELFIPEPGEEDSTYVYQCYVNTGIDICRTAADLTGAGLYTTSIKSFEEVITTRIPPEHVVSAWPVKRTVFNAGPYDIFGLKTRIQEKIVNPDIDQCAKTYTAAFLPPLDPVNRTHSISLSIGAIFTIATD